MFLFLLFYESVKHKAIVVSTNGI